MTQNKLIKIAIILQCFLIFGSSFAFALSVSCAVGGIVGGVLGVFTLQTFGVSVFGTDFLGVEWGSEHIGGEINDW